MKFRTGGLPRFCHDVNGWSWRVNNIQCSHSSFIVNNKWFLQTHDWVMTVDSTALSNLWTCLKHLPAVWKSPAKKTVKGGRVLGERCNRPVHLFMVCSCSIFCHNNLRCNLLTRRTHGTRDLENWLVRPRSCLQQKHRYLVGRFLLCLCFMALLTCMSAWVESDLHQNNISETVALPDRKSHSCWFWL